MQDDYPQCPFSLLTNYCTVFSTDNAKSFGKRKYTWLSTTGSWSTQRSRCKSKQMDLASILSYAEFDKIVEAFHMEILNKGCMYVGAQLHLHGTSDFIHNWYWVTGEPLSPSYRKWYNYDTVQYPASGSTSKGCVTIHSDGNMREGNTPSLYQRSCSDGCYALCETSAPPSEN